MKSNRSKRNKKKKKTSAIHVYMAFWVVLIFSFGVAVSIQLSKVNQYARTEAQLKALIVQEEKKQADLKKEIAFCESDAFVEKVAREQLNLVGPDEILFYNEARQ